MRTIQNINPRGEKKNKNIKNKLRVNPNMTLQELQSNLINSINDNYIINEAKKKETIPFDTYADLITTSMKKYQLHASFSKDEENEEEKKKKLEYDPKYITLEDKNIIKKVHDFNLSFMSKYTPIESESNVKVNINSFDYQSPFQSISIIRGNNEIHDEISKDFLMRQKQTFDNSIKSFESYTMKYRAKMPKIRIAKIPAKIQYEIPVVNMANDKKKKDEEVLPPIPGQGHLKLFAYYRYPNRNFPEGREQFSLEMKGADIILCGGISSQMKQMVIWNLNIEQLKWTKLNTENITNCRYGHSGIIFQNKIYLFGGRTKFQNTSLITGFELYSFLDNMYSTPSIAGKSPQLRRNHIAELIGSQMMIHGGVNDNNEILNDVYLLNLNPLKWNVVSISKYTPGPKLYGHASALVIPRDTVQNQKFTIYKYPDTDNKKLTQSKIKERGLYIFGGKCKDEGGISNQLWILIMGQKPLEWVQPETKGKMPSPRYYHTMNYYEKGNFLVIHGGRNDDVSESFALNDTFIFDLENLEWMKVELYSQLNGFKVLNRCGHNSIIYSNKLIIVGGMNSHNYLGSSLLIINLDFYYSSNVKTSEEFMIDQLKDNKDSESKKKVNQLNKTLYKNQLGIVTSIDLPPIQ